MRQVPLSELLSKRRAELGVTKREIANRVRLADMTIKHWESGRSVPGKDIAVEVAAAYELDPNLIALAAYGLYYEPESSAPPPRQLQTA